MSNLKNALRIKAWCEEKYGDKPIWERKLPSQGSKDETEKDLGRKLSNLRTKIKKYSGKSIEEIEDEEDRRIVEIIRELDEEYGLGISLKNALRIKAWCKEKYGDKPIWERKLPSQRSKDETEKDLGRKLNALRTKIKKYFGKSIEEIEDEEDRRIVEIIRELDEEYGLGINLKNALRIKAWCKEKYGDKPILERKLLSQRSKDETEKDLGRKLNALRTKIKKYFGKSIEEIEDEEDRQIVEIIRELDENYNPQPKKKRSKEELLECAIRIKSWCEEKYGDKPIEDRKLPSRCSKDEVEAILGEDLRSLREIVYRYKGKSTEEIEDEVYRQIVEIIRELDENYNSKKRRSKEELLECAIRIKTWCEENYGDKPIEDRKLPSRYSKDEVEAVLGKDLQFNLKLIVNRYKGKSLKEIEDEEDRQIVEIIRELDENYNPQPKKKRSKEELLECAIRIKAWCEEKYGDKPIEDRKLPSRYSKDEVEAVLGEDLSILRQIVNRYKGKSPEEIEDEVYRQIVEIIRELGEEYGLEQSLKNALKIKAWCEEKYGDKPIWERKLPSAISKDETEKDLGSKLVTLRIRINQYNGKSIEEIEDEEDRQIVEIIRELDREYGLGQNLKNALRIKAWCEEKYGDKPIWNRNLPRQISTDKEEEKLGKALSHLREKLKKQYKVESIKEIKIEEIKDEEDRRIVEIIRELDEEYGLGISLKNALRIKVWCEEKYGDKPILERKLPSQISKDETEKDLGRKLNALRTKIKQYFGKSIEEIEDEEDRQIVKIIRELDENYNSRKRNRKGIEIAKASIDSLTDIAMTDAENRALKEATEKVKRREEEEGVKANEQS